MSAQSIGNLSDSCAMKGGLAKYAAVVFFVPIRKPAGWIE